MFNRKPWDGKNLALLQAVVLACVFGLANVPNVRRHYLHGLLA